MPKDTILTYPTNNNSSKDVSHSYDIESCNYEDSDSDDEESSEDSNNIESYNYEDSDSQD